ncbi:RING finger protein 17 [Caerostris extrusa]|uniref:RING finger protein 17 n=1 Tax=Caerostris extrusa TaxID=172846 RepID=A0AAV4RD86_CAEEX|nr:RING finger protein 17 [Caerostris extrusa]
MATTSVEKLLIECKSSYSTRDVARFHSVTNFPRILTCCHSLCEKCLQLIEKKSKSFPCPTCQEIITLDDDPTEKFLPDIHALGIINANFRHSLQGILQSGKEGQTNLKVKMGPSNEHKRYLHQDSLKQTDSSLICGHCKKHQALWRCDECQLHFCSLCFLRNKKRNHEAKKIFAELYNSLVQEGCPEHENKTVEFYCEIDDELTCSYCMLMGQHVGHDVKTLVDKNKSCADKIKSSLDDAIQILKQLMYTDHLLCEEIPKTKIDISDTLKDVHNYFHKLHAVLQMREKEIISELTEISQLCVKPLEEMRFQVTTYEQDLLSIKKDAEAVIENPHLAVRSILVLIPDLLCYQKNIPEDFRTSIPESFSAKLNAAFETDSNCDSISETFSEDSLSSNVGNDSHSSLQTSLKFKDYAKLQPERVYVTHIEDPSKFFIQPCGKSRKLKAMSEAINKWCKSYESNKSHVHILEPGNLYLVQYDLDKKWYRARVRSIIKPEDVDVSIIGKKSLIKSADGNIAVKDKNELKAAVFYIDYGNSEIVPISRIKKIQPRFLNLPGLAKECSLADIEPTTKNRWSKESIQTFAKFVNNKILTMQILEERNNVFQVDLSQIPDSDISNDGPVSVRDALIFLEIATFSSGSKSVCKKKKHYLDYLPPESLRMNANIGVIVSHVDNPSTIYVQQTSTISYLSKLIFEMNEAYDVEMNSLLHSVYAPHIGMVCAAQYSLDKQWYRVKVIGLPGGANVEVQYVDFGNSEVINHKYLRKLFNKFFKLNIQAIPCKLAQVTYGSAAGWNPEVREWLTKYVSGKQFTLKSLGTVPGENKPEIVLYSTEKDCVKYVNTLLVEAGFAESTGPYSSVGKRNNDLVDKLIMKHNPPNPMQIILRATDNSIPTVIKENKLKSNASKNEEKQSLVMSSKKKYRNLALPPEAENYIEVHVSHIISPGSFYVQVAEENEKLMLLMDDLQKVYENLQEEEIVECVVGKLYAVFCYERKKWFRGSIVEKVSENIIKVFFVDYGNTEELEKKYLRRLMEKFVQQKSFSKLCHFDGIVPAGGTEKWSNSSCDGFRDVVSSHKSLFLSCKVNLNDSTESLPVDLFTELIVDGGALEPTSLEYTSLTKRILNFGYAILSRQKNRSRSQSTHKFSEIMENTQLPEITTLQPSEVTISQPSEITTLQPSEITTLQASEITSERTILKPSEVALESTEATTLQLDQAKTSITHKTSHIASSSIPSPIILDDEISPVEKQEVIHKKHELRAKEQELQPEKPTFQWKPAVPPFESTFQGLVTNIGDDGSICLYARQNGISAVDTITKALQFRYQESNFKILKKSPPIGEAVIAKFSVDNRWYRAEIASIYPSSKVKVNFVDYGNYEIVPLSYLQTDIIMKDFPRQSLECALFGIGTDNECKWDEKLLSFLHSQLVDSEVTVEIKAAPDKRGRLQCLIRTATGIDVTGLLLNMGFHDPSDKLETEDTSSPTPRIFTSAVDLKNGTVYPVCVTEAPSRNIIYLQILKIPNPKDEHEIELNKMFDGFLQLIAALQDKAENFPEVEEPVIGMACCAKYSYDDNWYRCEITDLTEKGATVLYVDYGNSETVPIDRLRELDEEFIDFPIQVHFCEFCGVEPVGHEWDLKTRNVLIKSLFVRKTEIFAKVIVAGKITQVEMLEKTVDGEYKSAFEDLVKENLVMFKC